MVCCAAKPLSAIQTGWVTYHCPPHQFYFSFSGKHHAHGFIFSLSTSVPPTTVNLREIWSSVVSDAFEQCGRQNVLTIKPETNIISEYSAAIHMPKQVKCVCSQSKLSSGLVQFVLEKKKFITWLHAQYLPGHRQNNFILYKTILVSFKDNILMGWV